jgi:hypothetical protein
VKLSFYYVMEQLKKEKSKFATSDELDKCVLCCVAVNTVCVAVVI